jgi:TRAP-type mannitol/chloroaromatic compound transport system permease small subunit
LHQYIKLSARFSLIYKYQKFNLILLCIIRILSTFYDKNLRLFLSGKHSQTCCAFLSVWFILPRQTQPDLVYFLKTLFLNFSSKIDKFTEWSGQCISWLVILLVLLVGYDVSMRYLFQSGSVGIQELEWHLFSIIFLIGAAYTLKHDEHVRLDLLYRSNFLNDKNRAWIDAFGALFILLPFCILIVISAWPFISQAYIYNEASPDPGGLPARWLIKSMIPLGFALLILQGIAESIKKIFIAMDKTS